MARFDGLTVLISGATGGFGSASAKRFAAEGAKLVLTDFDADRLEAFAGTIDAATATIAGDISDETTSRKAVELAVERFGGIDIALNNAGIAQDFTRLGAMDMAEAKRIIDIDVMGVIYAMRHQLPVMEQGFHANGKRAAIVNIASVAGIAGAPQLAVYSAAKHAVVGLTRSAAAEYARRGIRVNAVCPSFARTEMALAAFKGVPDQAAAEAEMTRGVPMRRLAEVDEIVEVILFAADPKNSFMTGQTLAADGGITAT
ncbi:MAG: SDR family oxidoreductase [Rhizobiaceae bacterium]|nr:SDR family oxidoreductase [Rhizobiaceae bacterium]